MSNRKGPDPTITAALIGVIGTVIVGIFTVLATRPSPPPASIPSVPVIPTDTSLPSSVPTEGGLPGDPTATLELPTEQPAFAFTPTTAPASPTCLDAWSVVNTAGVSTTPAGRLDCRLVSIPELGITTNNAGLLFTLARFRESGIFGVSTPLPENANVNLKVKSEVLYNAEFWIALSNTPTPDSNAVILALDPASGNQTIHPGSMRIYLDDAKSKVVGYEWFQMNVQTGYSDSPPFTYDINFAISGGNVNIRVNGVFLDSQIVTFPRYLFLGYRNRNASGSVTMNVSVTDFAVSP